MTSIANRLKSCYSNHSAEWYDERTEYMKGFLTEERIEVLRRTLSERTRYMTILTENTFHPQNASALVRHCEAFGLQDLHTVETRCKFNPNVNIVRGTDKWVDIIRHEDTTEAIRTLKSAGYRIVATTPHHKSCTPETFDVTAGPSASAVPADVSLFARIVTRTYQKVITYAYTYRQDYPELPATATADYNPALIYTAQYNESGDTPVLTGWLMGGQTYTTLPATREVTESYYEPLMKQAVAAMPSTGYYVYLCPVGMTVVISGLTATVDGGKALVMGLGIFKNIATNFIGAPGQAVIAQAFAQLLGEIEGLKAQLDNLGETRAVCINSEDVPKVQNYPMIVYGAGAPSAPNVPAFIGQKYLDTTNKKEYTAFSVTNSVSDWVLMN